MTDDLEEGPDPNFYFTGAPCRRGHVAVRRKSSRACTVCELERANSCYAQNPEKHRDRARGYRSRDPEKARAYARQRYAKNPEKHRAVQRKFKYGLTSEQFEALAKSQNYLCAICEKPGLHIDHDHNTGAVRGLLCGHCNRMLGCAKDDPDVLARGIEYLRRSKR